MFQFHDHFVTAAVTHTLTAGTRSRINRVKPPGLAERPGLLHGGGTCPPPGGFDQKSERTVSITLRRSPNTL